MKKLTFLMIALIAALGISVFAGRSLASAHGDRSEDPVDYRYYKSIQVNAGDTLWEIAEEYKDDSYISTGEYVKELKEMNQLESDTIHEGCYLTVTYTDQDFR